MSRAALDHVAVVFAGRAQAAGYGQGIRSQRKDTAKNRTLKQTSKRCGTRRVFCRAIGRNRVWYHHANRDVNRAKVGHPSPAGSEGATVMGEPMDRSKRVFCESTTSFEEAFPTIESATISEYEVGEGVPTFGVDESHRRTFGEGVPFTDGLIPCRNPRCRRGGYEVDHSLHEMVREKLT